MAEKAGSGETKGTGKKTSKNDKGSKGKKKTNNTTSKKKSLNSNSNVACQKKPSRNKKIEHLPEEFMMRRGTWEDIYKAMYGNRIYHLPPSEYDDIYAPVDPKQLEAINEYGFGDEYFIFDEQDGSPKVYEGEQLWEKFIQWMETIYERLKSSEEFQDSEEYEIGQEIVKYALLRDTFDVYMLMKIHWVKFRDTYLLTEDCPDYILEFVNGIMHEKMTEKQMWGTDEDRLPEGTVIVFDESLMPKEGEDTGKLKFEYRPNYIQEMMEEYQSKR